MKECFKGVFQRKTSVKLLTYWAASPRSFFEKLLSNTPLCFPENSTLFLINNMSFTYTYQKCCSTPTHFLVNTGFTVSLYKTICFDHHIKAYIPTPRCLHQSIDGSLELAHFVSTFQIDKTFWLHHIQLFFKKSIKECSLISICQIS